MWRCGLEALYRATTYRVMTSPEPIDLRIGQRSDAIAALHARSGVTGSVLVSAANPHGRLCSADANRLAGERLVAWLYARDVAFVPALGVPDRGDWPAEQGALVLGAGHRRAQAWCRLLRQNAVLWIGSDAVPRLCWHVRLCGAEAITQSDRCSFPSAL